MNTQLKIFNNPRTRRLHHHYIQHVLDLDKQLEIPAVPEGKFCEFIDDIIKHTKENGNKVGDTRRACYSVSLIRYQSSTRKKRIYVILNKNRTFMILMFSAICGPIYGNLDCIITNMSSKNYYETFKHDGGFPGTITSKLEYINHCSDYWEQQRDFFLKK